MRSIFPLADDFFPAVLPSQQRLLELRAKADDAVRQALAQFDTMEATRLTEPQNSVDATVTLSQQPKSSPNVSYALGSLRAEYTDLVRSFHSETREEYFSVQKTLSRHTADAVVLLRVAQPAFSPSAHESINWVSYDLFPLQGRADSCHYEATGERFDRDGKPFAFHVVVPAVFPEVSQQLDTVRVSFTRVVISRPRGAANAMACDVLVTTNTDLGGVVCRSILKQFQLSLHSVRAVLDAKRRETRWAIFRNEWIPKQLPAACTVCSRSFWALRTRHNCTTCRQAVCRDCRTKTSDAMDTKINRLRRKALPSTLCLPCAALLARAHSLSVVVTSEKNAVPFAGLVGERVHRLQIGVGLSSVGVANPRIAAITTTGRGADAVSTRGFRSLSENQFCRS